MKTGIIGAGKVGTSLGRYFMSQRENGNGNLLVTGFYDADETAAREAAEFAHTRWVSAPEELISSSDALFLTVPDGLITTVWEQLKRYPLAGKFICHCSGALSAEDAFPGIGDSGAFGYSVHPLFAVSDKFHSWKELSQAYFTIEGEKAHLSEITGLFASMGNPVRVIEAKDKVKYHLAAAICSNHVVALLKQSFDLLSDCGFDEESARAALRPIVLGNVSHVLDQGPVKSLTGPVERGDVGTAAKHLSCLNEGDRRLYALLSEKLIRLGKEKNPDRDYRPLETLFSGQA